MFLTVHAMAGIVVSESVSSPSVGFLLGILSHLALDLIPHGDWGLNKWVDKVQDKRRLRIMIVALLDLGVLAVLSLTLIEFLPISNFKVTFWAVAGALLPDFIWGLNMLTRSKIKPLDWLSSLHHKIQWLTTDKLTLKSGLVVQLAILALLIWIQLQL